MNWLRRLLWRSAERERKDVQLTRLEARAKVTAKRLERIAAEQTQLAATLRGTAKALRADRR